MKNVKQIIFFSLILFLSCNCNKERTDELLVYVTYNEEVLPNAIVYIKGGTLTNPNISLDQYDAKQVSSSSGNCYFGKLYLDNYFVYVIGYSKAIKDTVSGEGGIKVVNSHNRFNYIEIKTHK